MGILNKIGTALAKFGKKTGLISRVEHYYIQPDIPAEYKTEVIKLVGYEGNPDDILMIDYEIFKAYGTSSQKAMLVTHDMIFFQETATPFSLKLYSDTDIRLEKDHLLFNGQDIHFSFEKGEEIFAFLKKLISTLPASDNGILSKFERIANPKIFCHGQIPEAKLQAALAEYKDVAIAPAAEDVLVLIDNSLMGKADEHLLITKNMLYSKNTLHRPIQRHLYSTTKITYALKDGDEKNKFCFRYVLNVDDVPVLEQAIPYGIAYKVSAKLLVEAMQELLKECPSVDNSTYMGIFEQIIHEEIRVKPYIPAKFISNALTNFKLDIPADEILVLVDDTLADSFKNGLILTKNYLYVNKTFVDTYAIELSRETDVQLDSENQIVVNGKPIFKFIGSDLQGPQTFVRGLQCLISTLDSQNSSKSALEQRISQIVHKNFHKAPNIPKDTLANAIAEYAPDVKPEDVLCLFDNSVFSDNGKSGFLLTKDTLYARTMISPDKSEVKSFKDVMDMLKLLKTKKVTISPNDVITGKGNDLLINDDVVCSLENKGKEIVPQLVEVLNLMKSNQ